MRIKISYNNYKHAANTQSFDEILELYYVTCNLIKTSGFFVEDRYDYYKSNISPAHINNVHKYTYSLRFYLNTEDGIFDVVIRLDAIDNFNHENDGWHIINDSAVFIEDSKRYIDNYINRFKIGLLVRQSVNFKHNIIESYPFIIAKIDDLYLYSVSGRKIEKRLAKIQTRDIFNSIYNKIKSVEGIDYAFDFRNRTLTFVTRNVPYTITFDFVKQLFYHIDQMPMLFHFFNKYVLIYFYELICSRDLEIDNGEINV